MRTEKKSGRVGLTGEIHIRVVGADGKLKQEIRKKNLVVDAGLTLLANRIADATPSSGCLINYIGVGTGTNSPASGDTQLQTENARKQVTSRTNSGVIAAISTTFDAGDIPNSTLKEVGMFIDGTSSANTGTLFARQNINVTITALDSMFIDWRITFSDA